MIVLGPLCSIDLYMPGPIISTPPIKSFSSRPDLSLRFEGGMPENFTCFRCFQIELTRNYDHSSFHDDLRKLYFAAGAKGENTAFLFTDSQIIQEEFLEDINNILNSG